MRYIDNSHGNPQKQDLFPWLQRVLKGKVVEVRWQSGFFEAGVLGVFSPTFLRLAHKERKAIVLIGSNDGGTQAAAVHKLVDVLRLPRARARLGVVSYADAFYHPKTIHLRYRCGRQAAYVGSANLTSRGINGLNIEAGVVLDTDEGDPANLLDRIARSANKWFARRPDGLFEVRNHDDVNRLRELGILSTEQPPRPPRGDAGQSDHDHLPRRSRRHSLPRIPDRRDDEDDSDEPPVGKPEVESLVLIAELTGGQRWSQASFPKRFIHEFFQVQPDTDDFLRLLPVTQAGGVDREEHVACGEKAGSGNWYYELGLAAAIGAYPPPPSKPIGIFHRIAYQTCRYTILMPDDESYPVVSYCLAVAANRLKRPGKELPRAIVEPQVLRDGWPDSWFFEDQPRESDS